MSVQGKFLFFFFFFGNRFDGQKEAKSLSGNLIMPVIIQLHIRMQNVSSDFESKITYI